MMSWEYYVFLIMTSIIWGVGMVWAFDESTDGGLAVI